MAGGAKMSPLLIFCAIETTIGRPKNIFTLRDFPISRSLALEYRKGRKAKTPRNESRNYHEFRNPPRIKQPSASPGV